MASRTLLNEILGNCDSKKKLQPAKRIEISILPKRTCSFSIPKVGKCLISALRLCGSNYRNMAMTLLV